jgi:hypothetical protein
MDTMPAERVVTTVVGAKKSSKKVAVKKTAKSRVAGNSGEQLASGESSWVVSKQQLIELLGGQETLVQRMLEATRRGGDRLKIVANADGKGGRTMIDRKSAEQAYQRILKGEVPRLMESEVRKRDPNITKVKLGNFGQPNKPGRTLMQALALLPPDSHKAVFYPKRKTFVVMWDDGECQAYRARTKRGEKRRLRKIEFQPSGSAQATPDVNDDPYDDWVETAVDD